MDTDHQLLAKYRRGDGDAATALYLRYAQRLRHLASAKTSSSLKKKLDPEDVVQSVFRTFFRRAAAGQYAIPEGEELWQLLLVIGLNKIRSASAFHTADKRDFRRIDNGASLDLERHAHEDSESLRLLELTIEELLGPIPAIYRQIVELRIAGHEIAEIATKCGRSKRSVERILQEFRQKLNGLLHDAAP